MSPLTYKTIRHTGLSLSAAVLMSALEIGLGSLLFPLVQAVSMPLLAVALLGNFLIAMTMPTP
ncbi:hypothetical protein [Burkholderia pseudomallei]|uniref:hypothetical protein n=1 Tax=Burkholderia pseudomallei TaxID=28450 RepID=UPI000A1A2B46|nr:hypothetical protein [Burkholderia pseudomallei]ARK96305.1 hypothetical protein BOC43_17760 [Burkholderia pseudomallei]